MPGYRSNLRVAWLQGPAGPAGEKGSGIVSDPVIYSITCM